MSKSSIGRAFAARRLTCGVFLLASTFVLAGAVPSRAATFTVNSTLDEADASPFDGLCLSTPTGVCTLRAAVQQANASPGADTIVVPAGTYTLTILPGAPGPNDVDPEDGDLDITFDVFIFGAGASTTVIQADTAFPPSNASVGRVLDVTIPFGGTVGIAGVTIRHGNAGTDFTSCGGGVANRTALFAAGPGTLILNNSIVTRNIARGGGGLCNEDSGTMKLIRTSVTENIAFDPFLSSFGGGIWNAGSLIIVDSTLSANHADMAGGIEAGGQLEITNSTMSGNAAASRAGAFRVGSGGTADLSNVTITDNSAGQDVGGVLADEFGTVFIRNTLIAGNHAPKVPDCRDLTSLAFNLIGIGTSADPAVPPCIITPVFDLVGSDVSPLDARLGPLAYNGGRLRTHALLAGSPAIDAGNLFVGCRDQSNAPIATDQRGEPRPANAICDIGAYEAQQALGGSSASVQASTGAGVVTFATSAGTFGSLDAIQEGDLPTQGKPGAPATFPFGLFSWTVTGLNPGATIVVTITFPSPVSQPAQYWKVIGDTWMKLPAPQVGDDDGDNVLTLTITDGGPGDADGTVNGQISDPGGVAPSPAPVLASFADFAAELKLKHHDAKLTSAFTLGAASNGIAPLVEDVTLVIGAWSTTIPAGSLHVTKKGTFKFKGVINGVPLAIAIAPLGGGHFALRARLTDVDLSGAGNSVPVSLTIGNDIGSTAAHVKKNEKDEKSKKDKKKP